jgi:hypothetical protein
MTVVIDGTNGVTTPSPVVLQGSSSGAITLAAPAVAGTNTVTFPANTGTVITTATSGAVLQMVEGTMASNTGLTSTSTTYIDVGLSANITPSASGNKIVCIVSYNPKFFAASGQDLLGSSQLVADGNSVLEIFHIADNLGKLGDAVYPVVYPQLHAVYTTTGTSQITVKIQSKNSGGYTFYYRWNPGRIILMELKA